MAMQISKANMRPVGALPLSRYFSQTTAVAQEEKSEEGKDKEVADESEAAVVESAIESSEQMGSTADNDAPLASSPRESRQRVNQPPESTIFVSNMAFDATEAHLQEAFGKYGELTNVHIARDGRGLSRGFAFLSFDNIEAAEKAIEEADNSFWHGRRINVALRKERDESSRGRTGRGPPSTHEGSPTNSLYIGNIPYESSDAELNKMFRALENVSDVRVAIDRTTGWPRGFAHADFKDVESAIKAHEYLSQQSLGGRLLKVDFTEGRRRPDPRNNDSNRNNRNNRY